MNEINEDQPKAVITDVKTLAAAFHLSYLAGRGDAERDADALKLVQRTIKNMQRSMRRAKPTPRESVEAGLDLMLRAVNEALGQRIETEMPER